MMRKKLLICILCLALFVALYGGTYRDSYNLVAEIVTSVETVVDKVSTIVLPGSFSNSYAGEDIYDKVVGNTTIGRQLELLQFNKQNDILYSQGYTIEKKSLIEINSITSGYCFRWSANIGEGVKDVFCSPTTSIKYGNNYYMYMENDGFVQLFYRDTVSFASRHPQEIRIGTIKLVEENVTVEQLFNLWFTN